MTDTALRDLAWAEVDRLAPQLLEISHRIFERPELCFEEHHAHDVLADALEHAGLVPTRAAYGLDTAFVAEAGDRGPTVGVICEYDALPGLGHACGHNVIAAAGLGAGLAAAAVAERAGGRIRILGTPAEEGGGGKVFMLRAGAFEGLSAAMMVHPADHDLPELTTLAIQRLAVSFHGEPSHAAAAPHLGRNALDAAVLGYLNVAALRQHILPTERVHGVFTDGGGKPNIVPGHAAMEWYVRSPTTEGLHELGERVLQCLHAGALAAGCTMEHTWIDPPYAELRTDPVLLAAYSRHAAELGRPLGDPAELGHVVGSTDMGNVSQAVPSIHPMIAVAPPGVSIHTPEFAAHACGEAGDRAVLDGAKVLVATVLDAWSAAR